MHAEHSRLSRRNYAQGYPSFSHTNIFDRITTYEDSATEDPEIPVTQWFLIAGAIN